MATAKPKVKRMMFGGAAKAVGKAVAAKAAPMRTQSQMQNAARSAAQQAAPMRTQSQMQNAVKQDMNSKAAQFQRAGTTFGKPGGSQAAKIGLGQAANSKAVQFQRAGTTFGKPGGSQSQMQNAARSEANAANAANAYKAYIAARSGAMGTGPQRAMKKGGAVKKATKK